MTALGPLFGFVFQIAEGRVAYVPAAMADLWLTFCEPTTTPRTLAFGELARKEYLMSFSSLAVAGRLAQVGTLQRHQSHAGGRLAWSFVNYAMRSQPSDTAASAAQPNRSGSINR
ncbi:hypothetical protein ACTDI4_13420 [Mesorhizobium sp. PUT5]|uniref:hypothetical protein n=1 Tax=Mesorhizobium sp. PUT5 TaxID=3454629 RepID=UPI003FA42F95